MYDSIIFDLDGTLWDASEPCAKGWNAALAEFQVDGFSIMPNDIRSVSGLPFEECVSTLFEGVSNINIQKLCRAIDSEERRNISLLGGNLYEGVKEGISELSGVLPIFLVSNCQDWYLQSFWDIHGLLPHFKAYDCHGMSGESKAAMITKVCRENPLNRPIYIGDTQGDQVSSNQAGVDFGLMTYGFGEADEANHFFTSFEELVAWFRNMKKSRNKFKKENAASGTDALKDARSF